MNAKMGCRWLITIVVVHSISYSSTKECSANKIRKYLNKTEFLNKKRTTGGERNEGSEGELLLVREQVNAGDLHCDDSSAAFIAAY